MRNLPALRFPEFKEEWEKKKLGEVCEIVGGGTPETNNKEFWNGNIQWFTPTEIKSDFVSLSQRTITELGLQRSSAKKLPIGTILLTTRATIGEVSIALQECTTNQGFQSLIVKEEFHNIYMFNWIKRNKYEFSSRANGSTFPEISKSEIEKIKIIIPSLREQVKIADFLSTIDEKIHALKKKRKLLEDYKKGVMQKLFSQELRFKDENGKPFSDWEEIRLEKVCKIVRSGGTPTSTNKSFYDGDIPFLSIRDMTTQGKYLTHTSNHISQHGVENSSSWIVPENSLMYSMYASVGFVAINKIPIATSQAVLNLLLKEEFDLEFIYYALIDFQKEIAKYITKGTQGNLNAQSVKNFKLKIPSLAEQIKISKFLSSVDVEIEIVQSQNDKLNIWKMGLMQKILC